MSSLPSERVDGDRDLKTNDPKEPVYVHQGEPQNSFVDRDYDLVSYGRHRDAAVKDANVTRKCLGAY